MPNHPSALISEINSLMKFRKILLSIAFFLGVFSASASESEEFFSTEPADQLFTFGARLGINASNRTFPSNVFNKWNSNSWGTGIDVGAIANINFRDYLSVQPGIFFESRSGNFSYVFDDIYQLGHLRSYNFTVPIMGIVKFNVLEELRWLVELGPYFQFRIHSSDGNQILLPATIFDNRYAETNFFDFGIKIGTGLMLWNHYYFGIHYMAGMLNVWKLPEGGKNKAWTFTLGYDF